MHITKSRKIVGGIRLIFAFTLLAGIALGAERTENFDSNPGWTGYHNDVDCGYRTVTQNFGYKSSSYAGGSTGEIGGTITASTTKAYYGMPVDKDFTDTLTCSGKFYVKDVYYDGGFTAQSWVWFGWFNSDFQGWQPTNFAGMGFPGYRNPDHTKLFVQFGTANGVADRNQVDVQINEDTSAHAFYLKYDPTINGSNGGVVLSIDGASTTTIAMQNGHKDQGADFDTFGIFANNLASCRSSEIYFDDLVVNGVSYDFDSDPSWTGSGNSTTFNDYDLYGSNDYGYTGATNHAGGVNAGEMGGQWWNVHNKHNDYKGYFADTDIGTFGLDKVLEAKGKMSIEKWDIDTGLHLGWFNTSEQGHPPKNFVGIHMDSLTNNGRFFQAQYGTASGYSGGGGLAYYDHDKTSHDFILKYDPTGGDGYGRIVFGRDGATTTSVNLTSAHKTDGASLNAFGVFNKQNENGKDNYVYIDDLTYTVNK